MFAKYRGIVCGIIAATLFVGIASAEEKEPIAVLELGGASAWNSLRALATACFSSSSLAAGGGSKVRGGPRGSSIAVS